MDDPDDQEQLYRIQLQQAFNLEQWNDAKINSILEELLPTLLQSSIDFKKIFDKAKENKSIIEVLTNTRLLDDDKDNENSNDDIIFKMLLLMIISIYYIGACVIICEMATSSKYTWTIY